MVGNILFFPSVPYFVPGFFTSCTGTYNIWQDAGIRTRVAVMAARCATNERHTSLVITAAAVSRAKYGCVKVHDRLTFIPLLTGTFSWVNIGGFTVHDITRIYYYTRGFVSATQAPLASLQK